VAHATVAPTGNIADTRITLAPVGSFADTSAKLTILAIGITPLPQNTLSAHGSGINVEAST
jgi:hypothetical protein